MTYLAPNGFTVKRASRGSREIEALGGQIYASRKAVPEEITFSTKMLNATELSAVRTKIADLIVTVSYTSPFQGSRSNISFKVDDYDVVTGNYGGKERYKLADVKLTETLT